MEVAGVSNLRLPRWVRVRFLQRAHILANEAAARAGRGQAIAPTMDELLRPLHRRHSRGDGLSSPWSHAKIPRAPKPNFIDLQLFFEVRKERTCQTIFTPSIF